MKAAATHNAPQVGHYAFVPAKNIVWAQGKNIIWPIETLFKACGWKVKRRKKTK